MHGLLLCTSTMIKLVEGFSECNIHLSWCNIETSAPWVHHHAGPSHAWRNIRSLWQGRHRQGSRARIEGINTMIYAATIVTTSFRYLLQGNVQIVKWHNPKAGDKTQQTHCRQWSIPGAWLHGSITSWWSRYSFHKVQDRITLIRDNSVDFNHWIQLSTGTRSGAPTYAWNSWDCVTLIDHH